MTGKPPSKEWPFMKNEEVKRGRQWMAYLRVSTEGQELENQRIRVEKWANGRDISLVIRSEVESSRGTRPVKEEILKTARAGDIAGIVVTKLDRWARSLQELIMNLDEITRAGVEFVSLSEQVDTSSAAGRLQIQIMGAFAEFERELIRERTLDGLARARKQGQRLGRPDGSRDRKTRKTAGYMGNQNRKTPPVKTGVLAVGKVGNK